MTTVSKILENLDKDDLIVDGEYKELPDETTS